MIDNTDLKLIRLSMVTNDDYMSSFRENVQKYLSVMTLRELSERADVPYETLKSFLYSNTNDCKLSFAVKLAQALNLSIDELVGSQTLEYETKQSLAMINYMSSHVLNFVRWAIRDGFARINKVPYDKSVNVMIAEWKDGMMATHDFQRVEIDAPPQIIGKTIMGIEIPCDDYLPSYNAGDIILVANDRLPKNKEHILVHIENQFWIMRKDLNDHKTITDNRINNNGEYIGYICCVKKKKG